MTAILGVHETILYANDLAAAEAFYGGALGLRALPRSGDRGVVLDLGNDAVLIVFDAAKTALAHPEVPSHGANGPGHVALRIDDLEGWRARLQALGVAIEREVSWPRGGRSIYLRDPAGNSVELVAGAVWDLGATHVHAAQVWDAVDRAFEAWLGPPDHALDAASKAAARAGLPEIAVAPAQGRLLEVLARAIGARRVLEVGTLAGYSTLRLARALPPGGELVSGSVRGFDSPSGVPSNSSAKSVPFTFDLPKGATSAEVWFNNFTGAGSSCTEWDSNNGSNWRFTVEPKPFAAVQWVGNPGSSTTRACARAEGAPSSINLDSYLQQRACVWVESDVYVPGLTDGVGGLKPHAIFAEVETTLDGVRFVTEPLRFTERVGNDYRFHYEIPKSALFYVPAKWTRFEYTFRFSTDGRTWTRDVTRAVTRDVTFCNAAWATCAP
jgi:catechol 2,3-dioxygenase-like lactoylglutathione lyase family enzyme